MRNAYRFWLTDIVSLILYGKTRSEKINKKRQKRRNDNFPFSLIICVPAIAIASRTCRLYSSSSEVYSRIAFGQA